MYNAHFSKEGFFQHPEYPNIYVNNEGNVWHQKLGRELSRFTNYDGYLYVRPGGKAIYVHQLVADVFVKKPEGNLKYIVNHKDGDKGNPNWQNLEWTTYSGNILHAFMNGLRTDNHRVLLKDLRTKEVIEFHSQSSCAEHLGVNPGYVALWLRKPQNMPFNLYYDIVRKGTPWNSISSENIGKTRHGQAAPVVAVNREERKIVLFANQAQASSELGISRRVIAKRIERNKKVKTGVRQPAQLPWNFFDDASPEVLRKTIANELGIELEEISVEERKAEAGSLAKMWDRRKSVV